MGHIWVQHGGREAPRRAGLSVAAETCFRLGLKMFSVVLFCMIFFSYYEPIVLKITVDFILRTVILNKSSGRPYLDRKDGLVFHRCLFSCLELYNLRDMLMVICNIVVATCGIDSSLLSQSYFRETIPIFQRQNNANFRQESQMKACRLTILQWEGI